MQRLEQLTPGDFAVIRRKSRLTPLASSAELLAALQQECVLKGAGKRAIGFI